MPRIYPMHAAKTFNPLFWPYDLQGDAELIEEARRFDYANHLAASFCIITLEALIDQLTYAVDSNERQA